MANSGAAVQRVTELQSIANSQTVQLRNNSGLPETLRSGVESLSGMSMNHVQVHRNSDKPAQVGAHAFAQGSDIHLASGQEKHLPHEAWHVVQQAQGRVKPTRQLKGVAINDDTTLEKEADAMGAKAARLGRTQEAPIQTMNTGTSRSSNHGVAQFTLADLNSANATWTTYDGTHGAVNGIINGDVTALRAAYTHYASPAGGGRNDVQADALNPFLRKSVVGLLHDIKEIDSHAGGYYFQQVVKDEKNAAGALNIINQTGARGGFSNLTDPDLIVEQGAGGQKHANEVKRTTTANGMNPQLDDALRQLSLRSGNSSASVYIEVTDPAQRAAIVANRGAVDTRVTNKISTLSRGFGRKYWNQSTPQPFPTGTRSFPVTVQIRSGVPGQAGTIYDRDFRVIIDQSVGRRSNSYTTLPMLSTTRV